MNISVIIPTYNQAATLTRAVESALDADEIVIVNDANSDDTLDIAYHLRELYRHIRVVHTGAFIPAGVCHARNVGISYASGELILPLDSDDALIKGAINTFKNAYEKAFFVYGGHVEINGSERKQVEAPPLAALKRKNITNATFLFAKEDWRKVGGYHPNFNIGAEDYALMCGLVHHGIMGKRIEAPLFEYTTHTNGRAAACRDRWPLIIDMIYQLYPHTFNGRL